MSNKKVNIENLDKVKLLERLWRNQKPAAFFQFNRNISPPEWTESTAIEAKEAIDRGYIDYFLGRCIKVNLQSSLVDPWQYDECTKPFEFARIVKEMLRQEPIVIE